MNTISTRGFQFVGISYMKFVRFVNVVFFSFPNNPKMRHSRFIDEPINTYAANISQIDNNLDLVMRKAYDLLHVL